MKWSYWFVFSVLLSAASCKSKQETLKPVEESISESVYASGTIKSRSQYQAYATVSGVISEVLVSEGDPIKKGSPVLAIYSEAQKLSKENARLAADFTDLSANQGKLNDAQAQIDLARIKLKNDSSLYARQQALWKQDIGTRNELEQRELVYQNSKNALASAIIRYDDLKKQLDFSASQSKKNLQISGKMENDFTVRSEMDGVVFSLPKVKGEMVTPQTPLAVIGDAKHFILEMQVDENDILKIKKGLPVLVTMDSYKGKVFDALVTKIDPLMNERSKTFLVEAEFVQQPETLYPNTSFEANIVIQSKPKAILIPRNYLLNDSMVLKKNGEKTVVKTGLRDYQKIEILSGIALSDELVKPAQ